MLIVSYGCIPILVKDFCKFNQTKVVIMNTKNFEIIVDGVPYMIKATPFNFNEEKRFTVSYNGGEEVVFTFDVSLKRFVPLGDEAIEIPDNLESEIASKLVTLL